MSIIAIEQFDEKVGGVMIPLLQSAVLHFGNDATGDVCLSGNCFNLLLKVWAKYAKTGG